MEALKPPSGSFSKEDWAELKAFMGPKKPSLCGVSIRVPDSAMGAVSLTIPALLSRGITTKADPVFRGRQNLRESLSLRVAVLLLAALQLYDAAARTVSSQRRKSGKHLGF